MLFLLILCVTGLPLIFHHEIEELTSAPLRPAVAEPGSSPASLDRIVAEARRQIPGHAVQYVYWDSDDPGVVNVAMGESPGAETSKSRVLRLDEQTATILDEPDAQSGVMDIVYRLHTDLFAGLSGKLFLGAMGILFVMSLVSGVVLYGPSMKKLEFGTVRWSRASIVRWLDLHNLTGIAVVVWMLVIGLTGVINTLSELVINYWHSDQLADMIGPYRDRPIPDELGSVQTAFEIGQGAVPGKTAFLIGFPGSFVSSSSHYAIFFKGSTPLTSRLLTPVIVDAIVPALVDTRAMPWYMTALLLSEPLHFGDYGGLPLKVIWAIFDMIAIAVLLSGLFIWFERRQRLQRGMLDCADQLVVQRRSTDC